MRKLLIGAALGLASIVAMAQTTVSGLSFSVTTDVDYDPTNPATGYVTQGGSSATAGMYGYQAEWVAARSEFDLAGEQTASSVVLSFVLTSVSRPEEQLGTAAFMPVRAYIGDNTASLSDFTPTWTGDIGSVDFGTLAVGSVLSFDVTSLFNAAVARGDAAFGVGIDNRTVPDSFASFNDFSLAVTAVPEPGTCALMFAGLFAVGFATRQRQRR
jgi:hypothetical protein